MLFFLEAKVSASGRPVFEEDEAELNMVDGARLLNANKGEIFACSSIVTTHHIFVISTSAKHRLPLSVVKEHSFTAAGIFAHGRLKLKITVKDKPDLEIIYIRFDSGRGDVFASKVDAAMKKKAWEIVKQKPVEVVAPSFSTSAAGIAGIGRTQEKKNMQTDMTLSQAFTDLSSLMEKGKEMVQLAEKLASSTPKDSTGNDELQATLFNFGIISPVTKESAGAAYHRELARQLSDFLEQPIKQSGGMMSLPDAYCLYNRARGTDLITTDDMHQACKILGQLNLPITPKKFSSGLLVLQSRNHDEKQSSEDVAALVKQNTKMSSYMLSQSQQIPAFIAKEKLLCAERFGFICRDEAPEDATLHDVIHAVRDQQRFTNSQVDKLRAIEAAQSRLREDVNSLRRLSYMHSPRENEHDKEGENKKTQPAAQEPVESAKSQAVYTLVMNEVEDRIGELNLTIKEITAQLNGLQEHMKVSSIDAAESQRDLDRLSRQTMDLFSQQKMNSDGIVDMREQIFRLRADLTDGLQAEKTERIKSISYEITEKTQRQFDIITDRVEIIERSFARVIEELENRLTTKFEEFGLALVDDRATKQQLRDEADFLKVLIDRKMDTSLFDEMRRRVEELRGGHNFMDVDDLLSTVQGITKVENTKSLSEDSSASESSKGRSRSTSNNSKLKSSSLHRESTEQNHLSAHYRLLSIIVSKIVEVVSDLPKKIGHSEMERIMQQVYEQDDRIESLGRILSELKTGNKDWDRVQLLLPMKVDKAALKKSLEEKADKKDLDMLNSRVDETIKLLHSQLLLPRPSYPLAIPVPASVTNYYSVRSHTHSDDDRCSTDVRSASALSEIDNGSYIFDKDISHINDLRNPQNTSRQLKRDTSRNSSRAKSATPTKSRMAPSHNPGPALVAHSQVLASDGAVFLGEPEEDDDVIVRIEKAMISNKDRTSKAGRLRWNSTSAN